MTAWTREELALFSEAYALVLTAGDSGDLGVEVGMVTADGQLYVRAYSGVRSRWYQAAQQHGHGRIRVDGVTHEVLLRTEGIEPSADIDDAFRAKYGQVASFLLGNADARAATIRIAPSR
ncbi:DUF2255 family protein [Streptomyces sp. NPDC097704]|uniref:DUF2255 family protein n=1 Tax=Streptomyces sp. NPDC097704 TaxID=3157101 RepID=UPI0033315709